MPTRLPRRTKVAAVATVGLILLAAVVFGYPALLHTGPVAVGSGSSASSSGTASSSSSSGCTGPRNDGTVFVSTNATVSIEICGQSYMVPAGARGGLTYPYHAGIVNFTAPSSVNGSAFEFWYAIVGSNAPTRVSNATLSLNLPAGLASQSSLIQLFYTAPPTPAKPTTVTSSSTSSSNSSATPTSSRPTAATSATNSSTNSSSTAAAACTGNDGGLFVSTNVGVTVSVDICGTEYSVPGGIGGGLSFGYHAG
ncbi:MAG TPA: hypothetical protein VND41_04695, partial [Nitrososphaerales archaeon]|nr:hypothetical protein [Nitrososphaerales archaeon]